MKAKAGADTEFKATGKRKKAGAAGKPKRGLTPFFAFLAEFRPQYMEKHPEAKGVAAVTKAAGEKWRAMSNEEKAQYGGNKKQDDKASKPAKKESTSSKKAKTDGKEEGEGSDKSKSEVEDDVDEKDENEDEDEE